MIQTASMVLRNGTKLLADAGIADAARDARILMAKSLDIAPDRLTLELARMLTPVQTAAFEHLVQRRAKFEPISHIIGKRAFWGQDFIVSADVLDPRPDTETLIEAVLSAGPFERILDLGTGSGAILISLLSEMSDATGLGVDISASALDIAAQNAVLVSERIEFRQSDWFGEVDGQFDLIVSNPPYISAAEYAELAPELAWEPRIALTPEGDGLDAYRAIAAGALGYLTSDGQILVEIGHNQAAPVSDIFISAGFSKIAEIRDINEKTRVLHFEHG